MPTLRRSTAGVTASLVLWLGAGHLAAQTSVIDELAGAVTANEIASFKAVVPTLVPGESNGHNHYAYGNGGDAMEALGDMFDITKDPTLLDKLIEYCDKVVSIRNTTVVMWNGHVDPVWLNSANNIWGAEQGDVVSHLAYAAQRIAENPALWDRAVGIGDPHGYGRTYRKRAGRYLDVVRETMDLFYTYYIKPDETIFTPSDPTWPDAHSAGDAVPWNQQAMVTGAMLRAVRAHKLFGTGASETARYRRTAGASLARFFAQCRRFQYATNGKTYYKWSYSGGTFGPGQPIRYTEDVAHGGYDIVAVWRGYNIGPAGMVTAANGRILADTLMDIIRSGDKWWSKVDGTGSLKNGVGNTYTYLANFHPDVFEATVKTGPQYYADAARKLWIKQARHLGWKPSLGPRAVP